MGGTIQDRSAWVSHHKAFPIPVANAPSVVSPCNFTQTEVLRLLIAKFPYFKFLHEQPSFIHEGTRLFRWPFERENQGPLQWMDAALRRY